MQDRYITLTEQNIVEVIRDAQRHGYGATVIINGEYYNVRMSEDGAKKEDDIF